MRVANSRQFIISVPVLICLLSAPAFADSFSVNAGSGVFAGLTPASVSEGSLYVYAGPGFTHSLGQGFMWTTVLTLEWAPRINHWGLFGWSTLDIPLRGSWYANTGITWSQDTDNDLWKQSTGYLGPTIGVTANLPWNIFIAPSVGFYFGFTDHGWWAYPQLTIGKSFDI